MVLIAFLLSRNHIVTDFWRIYVRATSTGRTSETVEFAPDKTKVPLSDLRITLMMCVEL